MANRPLSGPGGGFVGRVEKTEPVSGWSGSLPTTGERGLGGIVPKNRLTPLSGHALDQSKTKSAFFAAMEARGGARPGKAASAAAATTSRPALAAWTPPADLLGFVAPAPAEPVGQGASMPESALDAYGSNPFA